MFQELYKRNFEYEATQEERRQALLEKQKADRRNLQDEHRSLEQELRLPLEEVKTKSKKNSKWQEKQHEKLAKTFCELYGVEMGLQQSEWLREVPGDLNEWLLVPCPRGQRSLVVAYNRVTKVYNKLGRCVCVFRSMLPGDGIDTESLTILDCIYLRDQNMFYVLDVLAFGGTQNLLYCEAECRFFWLRSKWIELEHLEQRSDRNQKPFLLVKQYDFENMTAIDEAFQRYPLWPNNKPELDGFLFYHRFANYTCGKTPLVGWLFAFMVPDVLDIQVNEQYLKPEDYTDPLSYMDKFDERLKLKWKRSFERERGRKHTISGREINLVLKSSEPCVLDAKDDKNRLEYFQSLTSPKETAHEDHSMYDDMNSDSDNENSLKKELTTQRDLEMLSEEYSINNDE